MITALYAGLLTVLYVVLAFLIIARRYRLRVGLGDGGDPALQRAIRVHGNFGEYVPLGLVLMILSENLGSPSWLIHAVGLALLCGRILHAFGLSRESDASPGRGAGMILTFAALLTAAGICLFHAIAAA